MNSDSENEEEYMENEMIINGYYETLSEDNDDDEVSEYDVSDDEELDEIYNDDLEFISKDKEDKKYYIGVCALTTERIILLINSVSAKIYFKHKYDAILKYLIEYSISYISDTKIHIMQLHIDPIGVYNVVIKTHWIRLIQRTWRSVLKERKRVIQIRSKVSSIMNYQIFGKHPPGATYYPTLRGMLCIYDKVNPYQQPNELVKCKYYQYSQLYKNLRLKC
jgi:hypothetical protein